MPPLTINVTGTSNISRQPELAIVTLNVSSDGKDQSKVNETVRDIANKIQDDLRQLSPKLSESSKEAHPDAAVTQWNMASISTYSYDNWSQHDNTTAEDSDQKQRKTRIHNASTRFEITFRDFRKLGSTCTNLADLSGVSIQGVNWIPTKQTKQALASEMRHAAVKDALAQAEDFARALGKREVWPVQIDAQGNSSESHSLLDIARPRAMYAGAPEEVNDSLRFEPEEVAVNSTIEMKFEAE